MASAIDTRSVAAHGEAPSWTAAVVLSLIVLLAAYLRLHNLTSDSIWTDEATSWMQATAGGPAEVIAATASDNYPPLHNLILWAVISLFGDSEWALRLPSAAFGILNVVAIYWVGTLVRGRSAGIVAALLLALSGFHIWYSQEARTYALLALSATLFAGTSFRYWASPSTARAVWVVLAGLALVYSHPYGTLAWVSISAAIAGILLWRPESGGPSLWRWAAVQAVVLTLFLPWAWVLFGRAEVIEERGFWIRFPTPASLLDDIIDLVSGPYTVAFLTAAVILAFLPAARGADLFEDRPRDAPTRKILSIPVLVSWAIGPLLLGFVASVVLEPLIIARYLIVSLPAILLLAAIGLSRFILGWTSLAAVLAVSAGLSWYGATTHSSDPRPDWRAAVGLISEGYARSICLVVSGDGGAYALRYYLRRPMDCLVVGHGSAPMDPRRVPSDYVYLIAFGRAGMNPDEVGDGMARAFSSSVWEIAGTARFRGVKVIAVARVGS